VINILRTNNRAFTIIELIITIAVLAILVAVVVPNFLGTVKRSSETQFRDDKETIWTTVAFFWTDVHRGPYNDEGIWRWGDIDGMAADHYFPTTNGKAADIKPSDEVSNNQGNPLLYIDLNQDQAYNEGEEVDDNDISLAAIWMGLLVNISKDVADPGDSNPGTAAPVTGEKHLYIVEYPRSSSAVFNGNLWSDNGSYTWIIGRGGKIYGCYKKDGLWYAGFNGSYP